MKLVFVIAEMGPGGAQRVMTNLMNYLRLEGYDLSLVTYAGQESFYQLDESISHADISFSHSNNSVLAKVFSNLRRVWRLRKKLQELRPDVVISFVGTTNILTILSSIGLHHRTVISERNDPTKQSIGWMWDYLRIKLYKKADIVTVNSIPAFDFLSRFVPSGKLRLIPNPINLESTAQAPLKIDGHYILNVGRLHHQKAQDILITAFAQSMCRSRGFKLVIAGAGDEEKHLKAMTKALKIEDLVVFSGPVKNILPLFEGADFFVLPSRYEGTPNALLEAMYCRKKVIVSSSCTGALQYVQNNISGLIVPPDDVTALVAAMDRLSASKQSDDSLGQAAFESVQHLKLDKVAQDWISCFQ